MDKQTILFDKLIAGAKEASKNSHDKAKKGTQIVMVIIIVIVILGAIGALIGAWWPGYVKSKRAKFPEERCSDTITMKFPNLFGPPGMTYAKNKQFCESAAMNETHKKNIMPIQSQIDKQNATMLQTVSFIKDTKKMLFHIRNGIEKEARDVQQKLYNTYKRLAYVFKVFARLFYRVFTVFKDLFTVLKYAVWTMMSIWNGPIGGFVRFFCFGEETLVAIRRHNKKMIVKVNEVKKGDMIGDNEVLGVCELKRERDNTMYLYGGVIVSGLHLVEDNGEWVRVHNHPDAMRVKYEREKIYNFITDKSKMDINNNIYCDYLGDNKFETYEKLVSSIVTNPFKGGEFYDVDMSRYEKQSLNLYPAFTQDSKIKTNRGVVTAKDLRLGDKINGKNIIGLVNYNLIGKTFITQYNDNEKNGMLVGIHIYSKNGEYLIPKQEERWILGKLECIGVMVEGGLIEMGNWSIVDFDIVDDKGRMKVEDDLFGI